MTYALTDDQLAFQDTARAFARAEIAPHAAAWDRDHHLPVDVLRRAAGLGFAAVYCQPDHGGSGLSRLDGTVIFEELAAGCVSTASFLTIHNMVAWMVDSFGTAAQRAHWLPRLAAYDALASYCLTEPGAGSDAANLATRATRTNEGWSLSGQKSFISGGGLSDLYLVMARTGGEGARGVSAFLVEKGTPGLTFGKREEKMGWHNQPTAQVFFDDVRVPAENLLGEEGQGFAYAMRGLDGGRLNIAACALGGAGAALARALAYVKERRQFGRAIAEFQATQFRLADLATQLEAARLMVRSAAAALDAGAPDATLRCAMAKRFATDAAFEVANGALQLFGGYGYLKEYEVERFVRDIRVTQILEGTNEVMRVIISRRLLA